MSRKEPAIAARHQRSGTAAPASTDVSTFLAGGGEMGERIRAFDWSRTPLGPVTGWPQSLRVAVRIMLTSRQPIWVGWGPELTYLYNDPYKTIIGGKHPHALGQPTLTVWQEIRDEIAPMLETALTGDTGTYVEAQLLIMRRHGYPEETYYTFSYSPIPDDDGSAGGIICANTDDTRRVIGERQLALLRELGARTVEARSTRDACERSAAALATGSHDIPFALIYLLEADGQSLSLAGSSGIGGGHPAAPEQVRLDAECVWPLREVVTKHAPQLIDRLGERFSAPLPSGAWKASPHVAAALPIGASGAIGGSGVLVTGLNPYRLWNDDYLGFLELVAGQIASAIANAEAYEQEKRRAESLAELDRAKTIFFSNVSHEFRTPLSLIIGPMEELLNEGRELPAHALSQLQMMHRNALRLLKMVNTLLDFSRIEAGRIQAVFEPTNLAEVTIDLASAFRSAFERAGISLIVDCPELPEPVFVDRDMWEKIVLNLLSNALKYTMNGHVIVRLSSDEQLVRLDVTDTGIGIPQHELPRLFERFHRVEGAAGRTNEGTGIGLALVHELVRLQGGKIEVDSRAGSGTTFGVSLPLGHSHLPSDQLGGSRRMSSTTTGARAYVEEALRWLPGEARPASIDDLDTAAAGFAGAHARIQSGQPARVLLVDDNADMRDYVQRLLSPTYEVQAARDGLEAFQAASSNPPDLVLTDVMMPNLDGFGLLQALRSDARTADIPVILLSARAGEEARIEGMQRGADDYLVKPFSARELIARVAAHVQLYRVRRAAAEKERELRAEAEAAEAEVRKVLESISDGFQVLDTDFRFRYMNTAAQQMLAAENMDAQAQIGRRIWDVFPQVHGTPLDHELHRCMSERVPVEFENYYEPWGRWYSIRAFPVRDGGVSLYLRDVTERKRLESDRERLLASERAARSEAERQSRMKDEFLATLSHELRTPLNAILGWSQLLRPGESTPGDLEEGLAVISRNARVQTQLIEDLLDTSRIVSGKVRLDVQRVDLAAIIDAAIESLRPAAEVKAIRVQCVLDPKAGPITGDANRLQQVMWNLLSNAIKFTPRGGRVQVFLERVNSQVEVTVSDTGQGIKPDFLPHVFERFRQADASTTRRQGGLGLGLSIVRHLAELHGGNVRAMSPGEGRGATFVVSLPLTVVHDEGDTLRQHPQSPSAMKGLDVELPRLDGLKVLFVDDEPDARALLQRLLSEQGAEVVTAASAFEALSVIRRVMPDLIISDIGMPDQDGYELLRLIRSLPDPVIRKVPAIALTAFARSEDRLAALRAGYQMHVTKPVESAELITSVASLAGRISGPEA